MPLASLEPWTVHSIRNSARVLITLPRDCIYLNLLRHLSSKWSTGVGVHSGLKSTYGAIGLCDEHLRVHIHSKTTFRPVYMSQEPCSVIIYSSRLEDVSSQLSSTWVPYLPWRQTSRKIQDIPRAISPTRDPSAVLSLMALSSSQLRRVGTLHHPRIRRQVVLQSKANHRSVILLDGSPLSSST
jgi:hypothetical protein